jgi:c-di-GMP-related signal transduction protein
MFWSGYTKELKELGRNDVTHNESIPRSSIIEIQKHLVILLQIMRCKPDDKARYKSLIEKLPLEYKDDYHRLIQYGAYYIIGMHFAKRGREGNTMGQISIK